LKLIGLKAAKFASDRGFSSMKNMVELDQSGVDFILGGKISAKFVKEQIKSVKGELSWMSNFIRGSGVYGATAKIGMKEAAQKIPGIFIVPEDKPLYLHIYYDPIKSVEDDKELHDFILELKDEISSGLKTEKHGKYYKEYFKADPNTNEATSVPYESAIESERIFNGIFALASNNVEDCREALAIYRKKTS
jgi:hypothetical protein